MLQKTGVMNENGDVNCGVLALNLEIIDIPQTLKNVSMTCAQEVSADDPCVKSYELYECFIDNTLNFTTNA